MPCDHPGPDNCFQCRQPSVHGSNTCTSPPDTPRATALKHCRHLTNSESPAVTRCDHRLPHHVYTSVFPLCTLPEITSSQLTNLTSPTATAWLTRPWICSLTRSAFKHPIAAALDAFFQRFLKSTLCGHRQLRLNPGIQPLVHTLTNFRELHLATLTAISVADTN